MINISSGVTRPPARPRPDRAWQVRPSAPAEFLSSLNSLGYPELTAQLLYNRGLRLAEQIEYYFKADYRRLADPFLIKDMERAVERIIQAVEAGQRLAIYGDFDVDGVTACSLLMQYLGAAGAQVEARIPHRVDEGYGLNPSALRRLAGNGVSLVITVDCGISNLAEVELAKELGLDIIITDHHRPPEVLPAAYAILNVRQPGDLYPYKGLVGVGVAFHLVRALSQRGLKPPGMRPADLLDLVALGTVADVGPLTGENRVLVAAGLRSLNRTTRPGLVALMEAAGVRPGELDSNTIGYRLAPRLNAAGRIDDAVLAYRLLLAQDLDEARALAAELNQQNSQRQQVLETCVREAREAVYASEMHRQHKMLVLSSRNWPAGVVGLIASRLSEEFNRPVLILEQGDEYCKGSARSRAEFNIIEALTDCNDLLERYGGHKQAAGLTVALARLEELTVRLQTIALERLQDEMLTPKLEIDAALTLDQLAEAYRQCGTLAPYGSENPEPVFATYNLRVLEIRPVGEGGPHLKLRLADPQRARVVRAIAFQEGARAAELAGVKWLDVAYTIEPDTWQDRQDLQLRLCGLRPSSTQTQGLSQ